MKSTILAAAVCLFLAGCLLPEFSAQDPRPPGGAAGDPLAQAGASGSGPEAAAGAWGGEAGAAGEPAQDSGPETSSAGAAGQPDDAQADSPQCVLATSWTSPECLPCMLSRCLPECQGCAARQPCQDLNACMAAGDTAANFMACTAQDTLDTVNAWQALQDCLRSECAAGAGTDAGGC